MKKLIKWIRSLFKRPIILKAGIVRHTDTSKFKAGDLLYVGQDGKFTNKTPEFKESDRIDTGKHEKPDEYVSGEDLQDGEAIKIINGKAYKA